VADGGYFRLTAKELKYEADSASRFYHALLGEGNLQDTAALFTFNWEVREQQPFTRDLRALRMGRLKRSMARPGRHVRCGLPGRAGGWEPARAARSSWWSPTAAISSAIRRPQALEATPTGRRHSFTPSSSCPSIKRRGRQHWRRARSGIHGHRHRGTLPSSPASARISDKAFTSIITELRTQ